MNRGKLRYKVGNLITAAQSGEVNVIAHGCNCLNTMKSGIAPDIAKAFPEAWAADRMTVKGDRAKLGTLSSAFSTNGLLVYNLYSQYTFTGRKEGKMDLDYWALRSALSAMAVSLHAECRILDMSTHDLKIGLPKIGAGLAGGDWAIISKIIESRLRDFDVTIYVLKESEIVHDQND
ncbi:hypothetical protein EXT67_20750 [Pectobacterium atrosepticum]|nr:macro domain-containing protein [Pectobacterium atrosepticum]MCL6318735.1 hypothetical protein [Pectobacterium atrosepticum]